jgi:dephospho-CoA kinase
MSGWPGKYIIGLTGNIATGKSVVRRLLEQLGAFGIDADALTHRTFEPGAPGYLPLIEQFGRQVLQPDGQVDRTRLGALVFNDPQALRSLEEIVHPLVRIAAFNLATRATQPVIVIEAIKLLESPLRMACDSLWVTWASPEAQSRRLQEQRGMAPQQAGLRIAAQPPQEEKKAAADVLLANDTGLLDLWKQVEQNWQAAFPNKLIAGYRVPAGDNRYTLQCTLPPQAAEVAGLINRLDPGRKAVTQEQILDEMKSLSYWIFRQENDVLGVAGWRPDRLIARLGLLSMGQRACEPPARAALLTGFDRAAQDWQCEVALIDLPPQWQCLTSEMESAGYQAVPIEQQSRPTWREAAREMNQAGRWFAKPMHPADLFETREINIRKNTL